MGTGCKIGLEKCICGFSFCLLLRVPYRSFWLYLQARFSPSPLPRPPVTTSAPLATLTSPPLWVSSLNLPGAQWPERSFRNIIWMVSILLWFPCPLRIKSRLPGPQDFVLAFFSSTITHEPPSPTEHGSLSPFQGSNPWCSLWNALIHVTWLIFSPLLQSWLKYHLLQEALPDLSIQSWFTSLFSFIVSFLFFPSWTKFMSIFISFLPSFLTSLINFSYDLYGLFFSLYVSNDLHRYKEDINICGENELEFVNFKQILSLWIPDSY